MLNWYFAIYNKVRLMLALLQDPVWQFVGAFLALVAIGVTVWVYFAQRTRRRLLVEKVGRMPLVTIGPKKIPGLAITVNDQPITQQ
jgi:preprotein translocase subunit SecY